MVLTILNGCAERVQTLLGSGTAQLSCYSACILLHFLARWNAVILENMTNYVRGVQTFRRTCNPNLEMSKWIQEGMAEGISPWMHFIGTRQEDRRQFENGRPLLDWHSKNEDTLLLPTAPVANVGLVWSQRNVSFYD